MGLYAALWHNKYKAVWSAIVCMLCQTICRTSSVLFAFRVHILLRFTQSFFLLELIQHVLVAHWGQNNGTAQPLRKILLFFLNWNLAYNLFIKKIERKVSEILKDSHVVIMEFPHPTKNIAHPRYNCIWRLRYHSM